MLRSCSGSRRKLKSNQHENVSTNEVRAFPSRSRLISARIFLHPTVSDFWLTFFAAAPALLALGVAFLNFYAKQRLESIEDFKICIKLDPLDHEAMYYIGVCYRTLRNAPEAIKFFNQAIDINSSIAKYFVRRGLSFSDSKNNEAAMRDFDHALEIRPDYAKVCAIPRSDVVSYLHLSLPGGLRRRSMLAASLGVI